MWPNLWHAINKSQGQSRAVKGLKCPQVLQPSRVYKQSTAATTYCASSFRTSQKLATVQRSCDIVIYIPKLVQPLNPMQLRGAGPLLCSPSWPDTPTDSHLATNCFHQIFSSNLRGVRDGQWSLGEAFRVQKCSSNAKIYPRKSTVNAKAPPSLQRKVSLHLCSHRAATSATQDSPCRCTETGCKPSLAGMCLF